MGGDPRRSLEGWEPSSVRNGSKAATSGNALRLSLAASGPSGFGATSAKADIAPAQQQLFSGP